MSLPAPADCLDMSEVRANIDWLDDEIIALLARRVRYVERAATLKAAAGLAARIDDRVREVLARVETGARAQGLPVDLAVPVWREVVEWSIAHETRLMAGGGA
jgi:isochorismate pyruvate lyase